MERLEMREIRGILWCIHEDGELADESWGGTKIFISGFPRRTVGLGLGTREVFS